MHRHEVVPKVKRVPGPNAQKWAKFHLALAAPATYEPEFVWDRIKPAIGPFCTDVDDNIFLDFVSHVGASPLGYNHPEIISLLFSIRQVDPDRYAGTDFISAYGEHPNDSQVPTPSHLHYKIKEITKQLNMSHAFFSNSGAEAVENAIKICYNKRNNRGYAICFDGAFHGRTLGALSLNRSKTVFRKAYPSIPNTIDFPFCACKKQCTCGWKIVGRDGKQKSILQDRFQYSLNPKEVAYIIMEPVQGEGGYNIPNKEFIAEVYEQAKKYNIPVIADEVQSGMGRTGKWWAIEHFKQKPDVLTSAKALRIGATIARKDMFPQENARISSTWGEGNLIASAVAHKTIELIQEENLLDNARLKGRYFVHALEQLEKKFPYVQNARGLGLMDAITIDTQKRRNKILKQALKRGLLLAGCGQRSIRFLPPLNVTKRELDLCIDILYQSLRAAR